MGGDTFTQEEFDKWIPARNAVALAGKAYGTGAPRYLVDRLAAKLLTARPENFFLDSDPKDYGFSTVIPPFIWRKVADLTYLADSPLWNTGLLEVEIFDGFSSRRKYKFFGVRFDPVGMESALPAVISPPTPPSVTAIPPHQMPVVDAGLEQEDLPPKGPPIAPSALKAWYEAYKLAYKDHERNLEHAWARARSAFPDKTVTRASVRALMPGGKPGPRRKG